jgi:uncharacterized protein (DUF1800 family)
MSDDVGLLLRRAGFGPTSDELAAAKNAGYGATLSTLIAPADTDIGATGAPVPQIGPDPLADKPNPTSDERVAAAATRRNQTTVISQWWLDRMTVADHQAAEKLLFFWHGHWATSIAKVLSPQMMLAQHLTLRGATNFRDMAHRMVTDPALLMWLDGQDNKAGAPNENLARELMELFTLGVGNYTEADVKEAARALTGWRYRLAGPQSYFVANRHDAGPKTILGTTAAFAAGGLVDLLLKQPVCPRFIATRLWYRYASSTQPIPALLRDRMAAAFPAPMSMLRVLFQDPAFSTTRGTMVKQPIEWFVGAMRQLRLRPAAIPTTQFAQMLTELGNLGQRPFSPPSVGGWPAGFSWLTSAAAQVRLDLAYTLAVRAKPNGGLTPETTAYLFGIDGWTNRTYAVLRTVRDPRLLLTFGMVSPEYLVT